MNKLANFFILFVLIFIKFILFVKHDCMPLLRGSLSVNVDSLTPSFPGAARIITKSTHCDVRGAHMVLGVFTLSSIFQ